MKLTELSYREYLAMKVFPSFAATVPDKDAAWRAFTAADEFLKRAGREHDKVAEIKRECDKLETENVLLLNMNEDGQHGARIALLEIWELLGVANQTAAVDKLHRLVAALKMGDA